MNFIHLSAIRKTKFGCNMLTKRESGEIVAFVWGKRDLETALALKAELKRLKYHDMVALLPTTGRVLPKRFPIASM